MQEKFCLNNQFKLCLFPLAVATRLHFASFVFLHWFARFTKLKHRQGEVLKLLLQNEKYSSVVLQYLAEAYM